MTAPVNISNVQLHPGDYLEFEFLAVGTPALVAAAVHSVKASLANDRRWHYQGSVESQRDGNTYITISVQVSKEIPTEYAGATMSGIVPLAIGVYVLGGVVVSLVSAAIISSAQAVIQTTITARDGNGKILAIWTDPDLSIEEKREATAAIRGNVEAAARASKPLISTGGGLSMGLIFAGGAILLFLFLSQKSGR